MSFLTYNGINLTMLKTHTFTQEPVYSEDGVDYLYTHFTIGVQAVLNMALTPTMAGESGPADTIQRIRSCLLRPRKQLTFTVNGVDMLVSPRDTEDVDDNLGPRPIHLSIERIDGSATFIIDYAIETWLNECCSSTAKEPGEPQGDIVSNRWSETQTIDDKFMTHRHVTGKVVARSGALVNLATVLKNEVFFQVPSNFERRESKFTLTSDKLHIEYSFMDVEVYKVSPVPSMRWEGSLMVGSPQGGTFTSECTIRMWGDRFSRKEEMIQNAVIIALGRLFPQMINLSKPFFSLVDGTKVILRSQFRENLHENFIEIRMGAVSTVLQNTIFGMFDADGHFANNLNVIRGVDAPPFPIVTDVAGGGVNLQRRFNDSTTAIDFMAGWIDDPCAGTTIYLDEPDLQDDSPRGPGNPFGQQGVGVNVTPPEVDGEVVLVSIVGSLPEDTGSEYDLTDLDDGVYTTYYLFQEYRADYHTFQMPLATSTGATTAFATTAQPTLTKVVKWTAEKIAEAPTAPDPRSVDPNNVLLCYTMGVAAPEPLSDGATLIWRLQGEYTYGVIEAANATFAAGQLPYMNLPIAEQTVANATFDNTIMDQTIGNKIII